MSGLASHIAGLLVDTEKDKRPVRHSYERLTEKLNAFIAEKRLAHGDKLPSERALAERFGVSRSSVREAIRTLAEKGLLESRHGGGTYVCAPDIGPLRAALLAAVDVESNIFDHVMEFRKIVEPLMGMVAAARCSPEHLNKLKLIVCDQQRKIVTGKEDGELDARFHLALAEATGNPVFVEMMAKVNEMYAAGRMPGIRDLEWKKWSVASHLMIIDALERRDGEACFEALLNHADIVIERHLFGKMRDK